MKRVLLSLLVLFYFVPRGAQCQFVPFDYAMSKANSAFPKCYEDERKSFRDKWKLTKKLYEKYLFKSPPQESRIPKIIHQIWLGGALPSKYLSLQKSWQEHHPDWEYRLWTDADLPHFPFTNRKRFEQAINVGEKADILRYEILYRYGGLYVDTDFECIQPFDILHAYCDFYVGIEPLFPEQREPMIGNALIGATPKHPIIDYCLQRIGRKLPGKNTDEVQDVSGPGCLRKAFFERCEKGSLRNVAFPFTYFYPLPARSRTLGQFVKEPWVQPETFGIHFWDTSWVSDF